MNSLRSLLLYTFLLSAMGAADPIYVSGSGTETFLPGAITEVSFSFSGSNGVDFVSFTGFVPFSSGSVPPLEATNNSFFPRSTGLLTLDGVSSPYYLVFLPQGQAGLVDLLDSNSVVLAHQEIFGALVFTGEVSTPASITDSFDILPINIPEPTTASLFLVGLIGWGGVRCLKRRQRA